jgi:hypothetical protein
MISTPTVFVLGAGASMPYGLPSGKVLVNNICQKSPPIDVGSLAIDQGQFNNFKTALLSSKESSVDAFLEHRTEFEGIGKKAIAFHLLRCENQGTLFQANSSEDFYAYIVDRMTSDTRFPDLTKNRVVFITFNYDRSLKQVLFQTIANRYGKSFDEVASALNTFPIIHLHGKLGDLLWQKPDGGKIVPFGEQPSKETVEIAANGIKIIHEQMDGSAEFGEARALMAEARRIAVMGFGYHPVNMRRLKIPLSEVPVFGTCFGFTDTEREYYTNVRYPGLQLMDRG